MQCISRSCKFLVRRRKFCLRAASCFFGYRGAAAPVREVHKGENSSLLGVSCLTPFSTLEVILLVSIRLLSKSRVSPAQRGKRV
eukprot:scaffold41000_cov145-Amphora_coffeaeformis.AAC.2